MLPERIFIVTVTFSAAYAIGVTKVEIAEALFVTLAVIYAATAIKVEEWSTLSSLGRRMETPGLFMSNESRYHKARIFLLVASVTALYFSHTMPWYLGATTLATAWIAAPWIGRNLAFSHIRRIGREMVEELSSLKVSDPTIYAQEVADGGPASRLSEWEKEAHITNKELSERLKMLRYMRM